MIHSIHTKAAKQKDFGKSTFFCSAFIALVVIFLLSCSEDKPYPLSQANSQVHMPTDSAMESTSAVPQTESRCSADRQRMVVRDIEARGVKDSKVLAAMRKVPRHEFVPMANRFEAYADHPLAIGYNQTISQPFIVALMTELLDLDGTEKVLEIGTGSGYQAAVLREICAQVYSIEIVEPLGKQAIETLNRTGYDDIHIRIGDGYEGWPEAAPFQAIILTAAPLNIPKPLLDQLDIGGVLVAPVGDYFQNLIVVKRTKDGLEQKKHIGVRFVPMTGKAQKDDG